jgi:multiple sugar transport system substrate-binding protein
MSIRRKKRTIPRSRAGLTAAALGCAALALTACSSSSSSTPASSSTSASTSTSASASAAGQTVTLTFWNDYNTTDAEASTMANVIIPQFEKENPGIKVDSIQYPYADLLPKFLAAAAAGDPPNLMRSDIIWVPQLASEGVLLPVASLSGYSSIAANALPGPLATTKWQGVAYALPLDTNTQALFWNKSDFTTAGISGPPTTLSQLYADAAKLTVPSKQQYGLGVDGTDIWNVAPYIWSAGGSLTNGGYTSASGAMNSAGTQGAVTSLVKLLQAGDIGSDFRGGSGAVSGETGFPKGEYAMYLDGPWAVPTYSQLKPPPDYGIAPVPSGPAGSVSTVGGEDIVIPRNAANLADTEKFAEFLDSPFAQLAMAKVGQMSAMASDGAQETAATPYYSVFVQQLKTAEARPVSPGYSKLDTDFSNADFRTGGSGQRSGDFVADGASAPPGNGGGGGEVCLAEDG